MSRLSVVLCSCWLGVLACGPSSSPAREPVVTVGAELPTPVVVDREPSEEPPVPPCVASPPTRDSLATPSAPGVLRIDASAPLHTGECVSPAVVLGEDAIECDATGQRCRVGARRVLIARELGEACVPIAIVEHGTEPPDEESEPVLAALAQHREACALHDLVAGGEPSFYEVERVRRVAAGRRPGTLVSECITDVEATASAEAARTQWSSVPLACQGLRCRDASSDAEAAPRWLFAHRIAGPLRLDALASGELPAVLEQLRERCR